MSRSTTEEQVRQWVEAARAGDQVAFGRLVEATWTSLIALARVTLAEQRGQAEDVVQDSYCRAWQQMHSLRDPRAFRQWIHRIVVRAALRLRTRSRRDRDRLHEIEPPTSARQSEGDSGLEWALSRLPPRQRAVLYLGEVEGYSDAEVGATLEIRPSTVRVHRLRARHRLRELLGMESSPSLDESLKPETLRTQE